MLDQTHDSHVVSENCVRSIKKSVGAVQSIALNPLTLVQRKLINVCLYHAYDNLKTKSEHRIHIDLLHLYFGYKGNNWGLFNESFEALQSTLFTWNIFGECVAKENISWERVSFLSKVRWDATTREFIYKFGEGLAEQFYFPDRYVLLTLEMQARFTSPYSLVLYEQCARYARNKNGTRWFTVDELKAILAAGDKYKKFKDFNAKILKPSIEEINLISDIEIVPLFKREQRAITMIKFDVTFHSPSNRLSLDNPVSAEAVEEVRNILINDFEVVSKVADSLLKDFELNHIKQQINYVKNTSAYRNKKAGNLAGYIVRAIKENYQSTTKIKQVKARKKEAEQTNNKDILAHGEQIQKKYSDFKNSLIDLKIEQLQLKNNSGFMNSFITANQPIIKNMQNVGKDIFSSHIIKSSFRQYAYEQVKEIKQGIISFDEYLCSLPNEEQESWRAYLDFKATVL